MNVRRVKDRLARHGFMLLTVGSCLLVVFMAGGLFVKALPILRQHSLASLLLSTAWHPLRGEFGLLSFLVGTLYVSSLAMLIAVPPSLLTAIFLAEYAPRRLAEAVRPVIDVLSGIPSVVYGVWGVLVVVPAVERLSRHLGLYSSGYCWLSGSLVLAVMVCPFIIHLSHEILRAVPEGIREASLSLGATRWQTVKHVVVRKALPGILAAVVLAFSRALGETIAVLMVVGNIPAIPRSLFDAAYPLPALLANNYGEMMSIPLYDSALLLSALVLLLVVLFFHLASNWMYGLAYKAAE